MITASTPFKKGDELLNTSLERFFSLLKSLRDLGWSESDSRGAFEFKVAGDAYIDPEKIRKISGCEEWSDDKIYSKFSWFEGEELQTLGDQIDYSWVKEVSFKVVGNWTYIRIFPRTSLDNYEETAKEMVDTYEKEIWGMNAKEIDFLNSFWGEQKLKQRRAFELGLLDPTPEYKEALLYKKRAEEFAHAFNDNSDELERIKTDLEVEIKVFDDVRKNWATSFEEFLKDE